MDEPFKLDNDLFLSNLGRCWLMLKQAGRKILAEKQFDLTMEQLMALKILEKEDGLNLSQVAERADRERTTMTRMVDGLERRNLVVRIPDKSDNRRKLLYLTHLGRKQLDSLKSLEGEFGSITYANIKEEDLQAAIRVLAKISENLGKV